MGKEVATMVDFEEEKKDSLLDPTLDDDSTELWLIQWPFNQTPDFDGQEVTLELHHNGEMGSFQGSSGRNYDVVSFKSHDPEEMVFVSSAAESKIVGKISRRVSLVHYPEPAEFQKQDKAAIIMAQRSSATSLTNSARRTATPTQTIRPKNFQVSVGTATPPSSRTRTSSSAKSEGPDNSRSHKKRLASSGQSDRDSGRGSSAVTSTGSLNQSTERKPKNKKKE